MFTSDLLWNKYDRRDVNSEGVAAILKAHFIFRLLTSTGTHHQVKLHS